MNSATSDEAIKAGIERITSDMDDPVAWVDTLDPKQVRSLVYCIYILILMHLKLECCYDRLKTLLRDIQSEILKRQSRSDSISCPPFLPIIQSFVNPTRDLRKGSHSRLHTRQRSVRAVTSPRSPLQSDLSVADTSSFISAASPTLLNSTVPMSASSTPLLVKSEPTTPLPANDGGSVATNTVCLVSIIYRRV